MVEVSGEEGLVHLVHSGVGDVAAHPRVLILARAHSKVVVVERFVGGAAFDNAVTEVVVQDGAQVEHHVWHTGGSARVHRVGVRQHRDSRYHHVGATLGGDIVRTDLHATLQGPGAEATADGLYLLDGGQHCDNHTVLTHAVPHCTSRELYRGVMGGKATAVFNGLIVVEEDAQRTDAALTNHNVLLSDGATVNTKPELLIYADDVKCSHGTTVGQLDARAVAYLRSRGIPRGVAERMLVEGFVADLVDRVEHAGLRESLRALVSARLEAM